MLHEICRESIPVTTADGTYISWSNSTVAVRTNKGIQIFEFTFNIQSYEKKLNWCVSHLYASKFSSTRNFIPRSYLQNYVKNIELTEIMLDPGLWPQNASITDDMTSVSYFQWSPVGAIYNNASVLAVLTNIGNVEIYAPHRTGWESKLNISMIIKDKYYPTHYVAPKSFSEILPVIKSLETTAICWNPSLVGKSCYLATAMRDSKIIFSKIQFHDEIKAEVICDIPTEFGEVTTILWIPRKSHNFLLICSNIMGQIFCLDCSSKMDVIETKKCVTLWKHKDRMVAQYFQHLSVDDNITLVTNKHRHLVIQVIDKNLDIVSESIQNINDYRITSLNHINDIFYSTTANNKMYEIDIASYLNQINVTLKELDFKDQYSNYEFFGASASANGVIWVVGMIDRKIKHRKYQPTLDIVFFAPEIESQLEANLLLQNPSKSLTNHWDCVEMLRVKVMKQKSLPSINYDDLYAEGVQDLYKLKIYLILLTLHNCLKNILRDSKGLLPEASQDLVVDRIYAANAVTTLRVLSDRCQGKPNLLTKLQREIFSASKNFLNYFCQKYSVGVENLIDTSVFNLVKSDLKYICQGCDEVIDGFTCANGHANMFCSITFTLIDGVDYLACKSCGRIARLELYETNPLCLFCDLYLNNYQLVSK